MRKKKNVTIINTVIDRQRMCEIGRINVESGGKINTFCERVSVSSCFCVRVNEYFRVDERVSE